MENERYMKEIIKEYNRTIQAKAESEIPVKIDSAKQKIYLDKLIEQYKAATGTKNIDINSPSFIIDFNNWIARNRGMGDNFLHTLEMSEIYYDKDSCAEIGKGYRDSLVLSFETTIITPYVEGLDKRPNTAKVIDSEFSVSFGVPMIYEKDEIVPETIIKPTEIDTFMTHNPYTGTNINSWAQLHKSSNYGGIIVGVFGKKYDKDMEMKIKQLNNLKKLLQENYIYENISYGDTYCHVLATDIPEKKKKLIKAKTDNQ